MNDDVDDDDDDDAEKSQLLWLSLVGELLDLGAEISLLFRSQLVWIWTLVPDVASCSRHEILFSSLRS